jgi:hypothetical protein
MELKIADMGRAIFETEFLKEQKVKTRTLCGPTRYQLRRFEIVRIGNFIEGGTSNMKWL